MPVTPETIFRVPVIRGIINEFAPNTIPFCEVYKTGMKDPGDETVPVGEGEFLYDVYNNTRTLATLGSPYAGPTKRQKRGSKMRRGHLVSSRYYHEFQYDQYLRYRALGQGAGTVDNQGQQRMALELTSAMQQHAHLHEWLFTAMFRGAAYFAVNESTGAMVPLPTSSGANMTITFPVPTSHTGQLPLGESDANLIETSFANVNADIPKMLRNVYSETHRLSGFGFTNLWGSTKVANCFFNNTVLQTQAGTAYKVFDNVSLQGNPMTVQGNNIGNAASAMGAKGYYTVQWRGLGGMEWTFRVCDSGMHFGDGSDETVRTDWYRTLPINDLLITPDPVRGVWWKKYVGSTLIRRKDNGALESKKGFAYVTYEPGGFATTPARIVEFMDKFLYVLTMPRVLFRPTVIF